MTVRHHVLLIVPGVLALAACATGEQMTASSTCHTSDGQFVAAPGCTISYSSSRTVTTTTTTTVETTAPVAESDEP